jgi:feruloyl esterase
MTRFLVDPITHFWSGRSVVATARSRFQSYMLLVWVFLTIATISAAAQQGGSSGGKQFRGTWTGTWEGAGGSGGIELTLEPGKEDAAAGRVSVTGEPAYKATFRTLSFDGATMTAVYDFPPDDRAEVKLTAAFDGNAAAGGWLLRDKATGNEVANGTWKVTKKASAQADPAAACAALAAQRLPNTTITAAETITGGSFTPPGAGGPMTNLPPFCRVAGVIAPTKASQILFEVWLPLEKWNGRFSGVGNGGWAGLISYGALADQLRRGYATASTNTGHEAAPGVNMARFAFEQPERLIDFAYRSHHETASNGKAIVQAMYGKPAERSYFIGCSSGGYEGLMEAQRFPADYDGIVAGAPANNWTRLMAGDFDGVLAVLKEPASNLPPAALSVLHRGVLAACDAADGVTDNVLEEPMRCRFDPATVQCTPNQPAASCLTPAQVEAARRIYRGAKDPKTGAQLYPGLAPGSEPFWPHRDPASPFPIPIAHYKWLVFADPNWDWRSFDLASPASYDAFVKAESKFAPILNATDPNLAEFRKRGGKLLQYHGWNDQLISAQNSVDYYESVISFFGGRAKERAAAVAEVQTFYRLFMAPGMAHCSGGTGPNTFDMQAALEQWVERGVVPEEIVATRSINGVVDRSRPLCSYPKVAVYKGKGDTNDAASFVCREQKRGS